MDGEIKAYFKNIENKIDYVKETTDEIKERINKIQEKYVTKEYCSAINNKKNLFNLSNRQFTMLCSGVTGIISGILGYNIP